MNIENLIRENKLQRGIVFGDKNLLNIALAMKDTDGHLFGFLNNQDHLDLWKHIFKNGVEKNISVILSSPEENWFEIESLDFIYDDSNHLSIDQWVPKLKQGGYWIGSNQLTTNDNFKQISYQMFQKHQWSKTVQLNLPKICYMALPLDLSGFPGSNVSASIQEHGFWAKEETSILIDVIHQKPGSTVIDVGSNVGYFSIVSLLYDCQVIAIEANKIHRPYLMKSMEMNQFDSNKLKYYEAFASDQTSSVFFDGWSGYSGIMKENEQYKVPTVRIDDICKEALLMKIDVEGAEPEVFRSSVNLIGKVPYILFELTYIIDNKVDQKQIELMNILHKKSYTLFEIGHQTLIKIKDIKKRTKKWKTDFFEIHQKANPAIRNGGTNIIAVLKGHSVPNEKLV